MKLVHQATAAMLAALALVVALVAVSMYVSVERGFSRYVRGLEEARLAPAVERLGWFYEREGSFEQLARDPRLFAEMLRRDEGEAPPPPPGPPRPDGRGPPDGAPPPREPMRRSADPLEIPSRATLYDAAGRAVVGEGSGASDASRLPLKADGRTVGWLGIRAIPGMEEAFDARYLEQVRGQLVLIAAAAVLIGILAAWLLARRLLRPIEAIGSGARLLAAGDFGTRVPAFGTGELAQLARDFNALAEALDGAERSRRRWVADTSHELRTPIAVLRAEIEAMLDGVRPVAAEGVASLHAEVLRLGKLVDDLGDLARADGGEIALARVEIEPVALLEESIGHFRGRFDRRRIAVDVDTEPARGTLAAGDPDRLRQVFANLLENAARYTDEGGALRISARFEGGLLRLLFDDSEPGVPADVSHRLFDRFYRVEESRSREHGGSGLGLAICKRLVEAHGGSIGASPSPLGGLRIEIGLPARRGKGRDEGNSGGAR